MTKKLKNVLLGVFSLAAMTTTCLSVAFSSGIMADAQETNVFEMVYGAGIRVSDPTGMRFKTKFSENYYEELTANNTDTQMFVSVFPYADYTKYDTSGKDLAVWLDYYYGAGKYINIAMDPAKFYQVAEDDCYYGNAVISNVYFNNYHREFVGVAYLRRGTAGNYTYEYTDSITKEENARSVFEVASKANMNEEDHEKYGDSLEALIKNGLYGAYGVTYDKNAKTYSLNGNTYTTIEQVESVVKLDQATLSLGDEALTLDESKQLIPALTYFDGTVFNKDAIYTWNSSNPSVATVDENGMVKALTEGETTITVTACGGLYTATCTVSVSKVQPIGTVIEKTLFDPATEYAGAATTEETVPAGFENVYKYTGSGSNIHGMHFTNKNLDNYEKVTFAIKATSILLGTNGWDTSNNWFVFTLTQTGEALWTIEISKDGQIIHTATNMSGNKQTDAYGYNALDSILYGIPAPEYYVGAVNGVITVYFTEVRGISNVVEPEVGPIGTVIEKTLFDPTTEFAGAPTTEETVPAGFENVYKYTGSGSNIHGMHFTNKNLDNYEKVTFAIKATSILLGTNGWDTSNNWFVFTLTQTGEALWTIEISKDGQIIHTATNMSGNKQTDAYGYNALDSILYGIPAPEYYVGAVNGVITVYFTEVRGVSNVVEPEGEPVGTMISESAALLGSLNVGDVPLTKETSVAAPVGFVNVYKYEEDACEVFHGSNYSDIDLTSYSVVTFAVKTPKMRLNTEYVEGNEWLVFTLTQTSEAFWIIEVTRNGELIHRQENVDATKNAGYYKYNSLASILYNKIDYVAWNVNNKVTMYITELRDISNVEEPEVELIGDMIADCAYEATQAGFNETTEIATANGFEKVYKHTSTGDNIHGMLFSGLNLDNYTTVTFAIKTAQMKMNANGSNTSNEWLVFTLTQVSPDKWDVVVTCNGNVVHEEHGLNGAYNSAANPNYSDNALDAILYGNPSGFCPQNVNGNLTVYVTELRGVPADVNPQ